MHAPPPPPPYLSQRMTVMTCHAECHSIISHNDIRDKRKSAIVTVTTEYDPQDTEPCEKENDNEFGVRSFMSLDPPPSATASCHPAHPSGRDGAGCDQRERSGGRRRGPVPTDTGARHV